jgi:hypothetical protein
VNQSRFPTFNSIWRVLTLAVGATIRFAPLARGQNAGLHTLSVRVPGYPDAVIQTRKSYWPGIVEPTAGNQR